MRKGQKHTEEAKERISLAKSGKHASPSTEENLILLDRRTHSKFHNEIIKMIKHHREVPVWQN